MYTAQLTARITLTPAQVKALIASPKLLVAGKAGYVISLLSCLIIYQSGGTPFGTIAAGDAITPVLSSGANALLANGGSGQLATGFVDQTVPMVAWVDPFWVNSDSPLQSALSGASMFLTQFNQGSGYPAGTDWTTGNGTLTVVVKYSFIKA